MDCPLRNAGALGGLGGEAVASRVANLATWSVALLERGPVLSLRVQFFVELLPLGSPSLCHLLGLTLGYVKPMDNITSI